MRDVGNDRVREARSHASKMWLVPLCVCVVWSSGCFTRRPPAPQLGQVTLAHPLVPTATASTELEEPPEISLEELALCHRAVDACAEVIGGARQRLEIDMCGDVGLPRIFQWIGEGMTGNGLKRIASFPLSSTSTTRSCQPVSRFTAW